jgi:arsenate reductase
VDHKPRVLFFSTSDSTRSQMAEGFLRKFAGEELAVVSTAVQSPDSHPLAAEVMKEIGVDISEQLSLPKILCSPRGMSFPQPDRKAQAVCGPA